MLAEHTRGNVCAAERLRSGAALESGKSRSGAQLPRMVRRPGCSNRGRTPLMATPVTADVALIADQVRAARVGRTGLRISGAKRWLDAGRPCDATEQPELG